MSKLTDSQRAARRAKAYNAAARDAAHEASVSQPLSQTPASAPEEPITRHSVAVDPVTGARSVVETRYQKPGSYETISQKSHAPGQPKALPPVEWLTWLAANTEVRALDAKAQGDQATYEALIAERDIALGKLDALREDG